MEAISVFSLPPGFGFHPTDVELISHYLKRKILGLKIDFEVIPEVDIYKYEPWDLPAKCQIPTRDAKWHFFTSRDRKYPNGSRSNRATEAGYWKSTGKDRSIRLHNRVIGTKKTLVFHHGRPPCGKRTEWIMHEYYMDEKEIKATPNMKGFFVLCRVTKRDGLEIAGENVSPKTEEVNTCPKSPAKVTPKPPVKVTPKSPVNVTMSLVKEESSSPSEIVDYEAWLTELYDPNFCAIPTISELETEPKEDFTSFELKQEPVNFLPKYSEGFHMLQSGDDTYSILKSYAHDLNSDMFEDFNSKTADAACNPQFNDGLSLDDFFSVSTADGYVGSQDSGSNDNTSALCVPASILANEDNAVIERREHRAISTEVSSYRIKLKVHKMEAKNGGSANQTVQFVNQDRHLDVNDNLQYRDRIEVEEEHSTGQSSDSVGSQLGSLSCTLGIIRHLFAFLHRCASGGLNSFFLCAFMMGIVAVILYFLLKDAHLNFLIASLP